MPVSEQTPRNSYTANGATTVFAYDFKALTSADILVTVDGVTKTLTTDYTLSGVGSDVGGNVTFLVAPVNTATVVIQRDIAYDRTVDYQENGDFAAATIDNDIDRVVMQLQQLNARALTANTSGTVDATDKRIINLSTPTADSEAATKGYVDSYVQPIADAAAASASAAATSESNAAASASAASTSASNAASSYDAFDDRYLGSKASDPTLDNDGNALLTGALYWNSSTNKLKIYSGSAWQDTATATPSSFTANAFSGTGAQTAFTLSATPANVQSCLVFVAGVRQRPTLDYTVSGTTLTFGVAPASGTNNVTVLTVSSLAAGVPDNDSVSTAKLQDDAVTFAKIQNIATSKLLGRSTAGSGDVEEISVGTGLSLVGGTLSAAASGALLGYQVFTAGGTYTKATNNPSFVIVEVIGGGGGGGGGSNGSGNTAAGGGGAGGYAMKKIAASSLLASETVTVGNSGAAGNTAGGNGGTGGTSSFGAHVSATGGSGGTGSTGATVSAGGAGGSGSSGDLNLAGGRGGAGNGAVPGAGNGGDGVKGGGGGVNMQSGTANSLAGYAGATNTGGGGGGGKGSTTGGGAAGGAGGSGLVIVWEYT